MSISYTITGTLVVKPNLSTAESMALDVFVRDLAEDLVDPEEQQCERGKRLIDNGTIADSISVYVHATETKKEFEDVVSRFEALAPFVVPTTLECTIARENRSDKLVALVVSDDPEFTVTSLSRHNLNEVLEYLPGGLILPHLEELKKAVEAAIESKKKAGDPGLEANNPGSPSTPARSQ